MMKYFTDDIDYPSVFEGEILPPGVMWSYISSTFLNGFANYAKPVKAYLMDRYTPWNSVERFDENRVDPVRINDEWVKRKFTTKKDLYDFAVTNPNAFFHTRIGMFQDDIMLLSKCEHAPGKYIFFWFNCDVSDCCIGVFQTEDSEEEVIAEFDRYALERGSDLQKRYNNKLTMEEAKTPIGELPVRVFAGWIRF